MTSNQWLGGILGGGQSDQPPCDHETREMRKGRQACAVITHKNMTCVFLGLYSVLKFWGEKFTIYNFVIFVFKGARVPHALENN